MLNVWRVVPAVSSALLVLVPTVFSLVLLESAEARTAGDLGYHGETVRVVAVPDDGYAGPERLTDALAAFSSSHAVSIAYSRSYGSGVVTLSDEHGRFRDGEGSLAARLGPAGAGPAAAVTDALAGSSAVGSVLQGVEGVVVTGSFDSDVLFEGQAPAVLFNADAIPFGEGVYLFAGTGPAEVEGGTADLVARVFEDTGMAVVDLMPLDNRTGWSWLLRSLRTPYGVVVLLFGGVLLLTQLVVLLIHAETFRDRSTVAAVLGAAKHRGRTLILRRLARQVLVGSVIGATFSMAVVLGADGASLLAAARRIALVPAALASGLGTSVALCWFVAWREARRVAYVVPS